MIWIHVSEYKFWRNKLKIEEVKDLRWIVLQQAPCLNFWIFIDGIEMRYFFEQRVHKIKLGVAGRTKSFGVTQMVGDLYIEVRQYSRCYIRFVWQRVFKDSTFILISFYKCGFSH